MKTSLKITVSIISSILISSCFIQLYAQELSDDLDGTYSMSADATILTLVLKKDNNLNITGSLSSTTGISYQLEGEIIEKIATGICSGNEGSLFFEIYKVQNELVMSLIEPDGSNMPDYNTATYLSFIQDSSNPSGMVSSENKQQYTIQSGSVTQPVFDNEIGDPFWGFKFKPPDGWTHQKTSEGLIMGHNIIAGMIIIFPHTLKTTEELQQEMQKGIQEEGNYLSLYGSVSQIENNIYAGDYSGMMDGQQVKAKGFGTLSPYGSGAFIIAVSIPEKLGSEIIRDANSIASNLIYTKIDVSDLIRHFAGKWTNFTTNTSTWLRLYPDGTYDEQYESSYSGDFDNDAGNWGVAGNENAKGQWTVQGNKDSGRIVVRLSNGNEIVYEYRVHEERGEKYYSEYWFNGKLYSKSQE